MSLALWAQTTPSFSPQEVGIDEKLGKVAALDVPLKDEDGKTTTLRALLDKPTILTLNYFRCAGICTPQLNGIVEVLNRTQAVPGQDFQLITVSFDERDTPEIAAQKRTNYLREITRPFPPTAWRFLTGTAADTKAVADSVGFKFKAHGEDFIHAGALMFLSPKGEITRYMYGTTYLPADLQMAAQEAAKGEARPTINKWLKICFSYDPEGRRYVFSFTRVAAILLLGGAVIFLVTLLRKGRKNPSESKERS
ncbi:MAG: SCO family protein [Firmicutes bacterium]|nr:SCO family protein [Bacillota bacterium]